MPPPEIANLEYAYYWEEVRETKIYSSGIP